jgi:hypothetical protein
MIHGLLILLLCYFGAGLVNAFIIAPAIDKIFGMTSYSYYDVEIMFWFGVFGLCWSLIVFLIALIISITRFVCFIYEKYSETNIYSYIKIKNIRFWNYLGNLVMRVWKLKPRDS